MNHCPVFGAIGGHAYGWVYPGPMGAVLTPSLIGVDKAGHLPNASTFCGRCEEVCPVRIPLPRMMRSWREREFERHLSPATVRHGIALWAFFAKRPVLYGAATAIAARVLSLMGTSAGRFRRLPLASAWTRDRDFPAPQGATFQSQWKRRQPARDRALAAPSPLVGEGRGGGLPQAPERIATPTPDPSPQGGGENSVPRQMHAPER